MKRKLEKKEKKRKKQKKLQQQQENGDANGDAEVSGLTASPACVDLRRGPPPVVPSQCTAC